MKWRVLLTTLLLFGLLSSVAYGQNPESSTIIKVGVTQIVDHPALDASRQGFIDRLEELGYKKDVNIKYDIQSAQGETSLALMIAQKFVADQVDLILAIATPTSQAAASVTERIPIVFTAVTDPVVAELVQSIEKPGTNLTGTSDLTPVAQQLELLVKIAPNAKRVGVVYNSGEVNSVVQVDLAKEAAKALGLTIVEAVASNTSEVLTAARSLQGRVDAIYIPTCNTAVAALESIVMVAEQIKVPLIVGEEDSVARGGLATFGINYYNLGRQTADIAVRILSGENPAEIPVEYYKMESELVINTAAAERMGITFSEELLNEAVVIYTE
jgi:putative ABC transport system substrate-binding protein